MRRTASASGATTFGGYRSSRAREAIEGRSRARLRRRRRPLGEADRLTFDVAITTSSHGFYRPNLALMITPARRRTQRLLQPSRSASADRRSSMSPSRTASSAAYLNGAGIDAVPTTQEWTGRPHRVQDAFMASDERSSSRRSPSGWASTNEHPLRVPLQHAQRCENTARRSFVRRMAVSTCEMLASADDLVSWKTSRSEHTHARGRRGPPADVRRRANFSTCRRASYRTLLHRRWSSRRC